MLLNSRLETFAEKPCLSYIYTCFCSFIWCERETERGERGKKKINECKMWEGNKVKGRGSEKEKKRRKIRKRNG